MTSWRTSPRVPMVLVVVIVLAVLGGIVFTMAQTSSAAGTETSQEAPPGKVWLAEPAPTLIVNDVQVVSESTADKADRRSISFALPQPGGAAADSARFAALLTEQAAAWQDHFDSQVHLDQPGSELNISWQIVTASGSVLGERLTYYGFTAGEAKQSFAATFFTDVLTGESWHAQELLHAEASGVVADAWHRLYRQVPGGFHPSRVDVRELSVVDVALLPDGHVVVALPAGVVANVSAGPLWLEFDADSAARILSPVGLRLSQQVARGVPFDTQAQLGDFLTAVPSDDPTEEPTEGPNEVPNEEPGSVPSVPDDASVDQSLPEVDCVAVKCVALTFDDGPGVHTEKIVQDLEDRGAAATFFVVGKNAQVRPELLQRIVDGGHELGNHTLSHGDLTKFNAGRITKEIATTNEAIAAATGLSPTLTRPPYGAINQSTLDVLGELEQAVVMWDVDSEDWRSRNTGQIVEEVVNSVQPGSIVLLHDIHATTAAAVPKIADQLIDEGYQLVTVSQLLGATEPGVKYFHGSRE